MRRHIAAMLVVVITCAGFAVRAGEHPWNNKRIYYVIEHMGKLVEKGTFVRRIGSYQKQTCWVLEEERFFFNPVNSQMPERGVKTRILTGMRGEALQRTETPFEGQGGKEAITIINGEARIDANGIYGLPGRVPVPKDTLFEIGGEYLATLRRRRGATYSASVLDRATRGVVTAEILISGQEKQGGGDTTEVWLADIATPGRPPVTAFFTPDGRLLRLEGGGMQYQVVAREDFELGRIPPRGIEREPSPDRRRSLARAGGDAQVSDVEVEGEGESVVAQSERSSNVVIPIGASVPAWDSFAWLLLVADPAYDWTSALSTSEYARVENNGPQASITALRNAPIVDAVARFPMNVPPDIRPYMLASELIPSDHVAVVEAAYAAIADNESRREETNVLRAVSFLAGWINQSVEVEDWKGYNSSALDTLARRAGDSLGHARLFCAMARTLGVPTRVCQGFLAHMDGAVNHCWAEAWINGRWIPVDTTVSRVGLPAGYVLAERGQNKDAFRYDFVNFMRNPALKLRLYSAGRETPSGGLAELVVGDRRTFAFSEDDWLTNLYWGFALRLPDGWVGRARLNSVELASANRQASVKVEALEGDFQAGRPELESTIADLRQNLQRFKVIDSRVVSFDADGATPALFIDFTCYQDNKTLRCRQYVVPRRQRAFRLSFWAPADVFRDYSKSFDSVLASVEF